MRASSADAELERKQREALFANRQQLWELAHRGFEVGGRGLIVADGSQVSRASPVAVRWRSGREILNGRGNTFGWVPATAAHLREYNPQREFVLQYVSPQAEVHVYRVSVPGARSGKGTGP